MNGEGRLKPAPPPIIVGCSKCGREFTFRLQEGATLPRVKHVSGGHQLVVEGRRKPQFGLV